MQVHKGVLDSYIAVSTVFTTSSLWKSVIEDSDKLASMLEMKIDESGRPPQEIINEEIESVKSSIGLGGTLEYKFNMIIGFLSNYWRYGNELQNWYRSCKTS